MSRALLRVVAAAVLAVLAMTAAGSAASAAPQAPASVLAAEDDPGPGAFGFDLKDSHGVSVWDMNLSLDHGSSWNPTDEKRPWAWVMEAGWAVYRLTASVEIWTLNWVLGLDWMDWVLTPMRGFANLTHQFMTTLGLLPLMLLVLAVVVSLWLLRGRYGTGVVELLIGCVIASLAVGALSDPMDVIAGPDGMVMKGRDAGFELASAVVSDGQNTNGNIEDYRNGLTESLVDAMIRTPHQILNYGEVIDGTGCESVYDQAVATDDARHALEDCDADLGHYAGNPDSVKAMAVLVLLPSTTFLALFSFSLVILVIITVLGAAWTAIKLIWQLVFGVVPGGSRTALFRSLAMSVFAMFMVASAVVFVVVWMKFLIGFFQSSDGIPWQVRIWLLDGLLVIGGVGIWIFRHKVKMALRNAADRLSHLGAGSAPPQPMRMPSLPRTVRTTRVLPPPQTPGPAPMVTGRPAPIWVNATVNRPGGGAAGATAAGLVTAAAAPRLLGPGGGASAARGASGPPPSSGGGGSPARPAPRRTDPSAGARLRSRLAKGAWAAAQVGAAVATGGSSAAATAGANAAMGATRVAAAAGAKQAAAKGAAAAAGKGAAAAAGKGAAAAAGKKAAAAGTRRAAGSAARSAASRAARSTLNEQVRSRLSDVAMRQTAPGRAVDDATGRNYRVTRASGGVEILSPDDGADS